MRVITPYFSQTWADIIYYAPQPENLFSSQHNKVFNSRLCRRIHGYPVATCSSSNLFTYVEVKSTELRVITQVGVESRFQVAVIVPDLEAGSVL